MADDEIDRLYGLPLDEFVPERDALAKRLRAAGDRTGADEVKKLPKPTRAAWAVNRLVRDQPADVKALVSAGKALARAQKDLLSGADPGELRDAAAEARGAVDRLVAAADATGATAEKVRSTLHAATVDPEVRDAVAAGRLVRERSAAGFGGLDALAASLPARRGGRTASTAPAARGGGKQGAGAGARTAAPEAPARDAKAEAEERRRRDALRRAKEAEAEAEGEVAAAERALAQTEAALASRRADVDSARVRLSEARRRRERAERRP